MTGRMSAPMMRAIWSNGLSSPRRRKFGSPNGLATKLVAIARSTDPGPTGPRFAPRSYRRHCSLQRSRSSPMSSGVGWPNHRCALSSWLPTPGRRRLLSCAVLSTRPSLKQTSRAPAHSCSTRPKPYDGFEHRMSSPRMAVVHTDHVEKEIGDLPRRCHCVIVRPGNDVNAKPDIRLGLPGWKDFSDALESMGLSGHRIDMLARESGRSPTVLRRRLSTSPAVRDPAWAGEAHIARKLLAVALVGAWCKTSPADCEVVRRLAHADDDNDVETCVTELLALEDPPIWSTGECRGVVSRIDALFGIARFVTESDIDNLFSVAEHVLSEADPALELSEDAEMVGQRVWQGT